MALRKPPHPELGAKRHVEGRTTSIQRHLEDPQPGRGARRARLEGRGPSHATDAASLCSVLLLGTLAACAPSSDYRPAIDLNGLDQTRYETDLSDCKKVAEHNRFGPLAVGLLHGAMLGAALGAVGAAIAGGNVGLAMSYGALSGTAAGGTVGATQIHEPVDEQAVVDQCLRNNGYGVTGR